MKAKGRRLLAAMLCLLTFIGVVPVEIYAFTPQEGQIVSSYHGEDFVGSDGKKYYAAPRTYIVYDNNGGISVRTSKGSAAREKYMIRDKNGNTRMVYCVESSIPFADTENGYVSSSGKNSRYFQNLPYSAQFGIMLATVYGWQPGKASPVSGTNEDDYIVATQILIWEYQQLIRTSPTKLSDNAYGVAADTFLKTITGRPAKKCYDWILEQMSKHTTIPSFASDKSSSAKTHTLKYDVDSKTYTLTLEDTNNTLNDIRFSNSNGITVKRNGNKYTFTSEKMITDAVTITAQKKIASVKNDMLIWGRVGYQTMLCGSEDPVVFYLKINTETYGTGLIKKTSEDEKIDSVKFHIEGNGVDKTVTTKKDGTVDVELMPGKYTITEVVGNRYEPQKAQMITIVSGHTSEVIFNNKLKRGKAEVIKTSEDNLVEGVTFRLYGTALSGDKVDAYAVTDASGKAVFEDILISGNEPYILEEVDTATRYVIPEAQSTPIEWNKVTERSVHNVLKKFRVEVTKTDKETGHAQAEATLAGAEYGLYKGEKLMASYTTDAKGSFVSDYFICGDDWSLREISPSEGYLLDETIYKIPADAGNFQIELNSVDTDVVEEVIKGRIRLVKHIDAEIKPEEEPRATNEGIIEQPEEGAKFQIFLTNAGSYENARESERDELVTDADGFAVSKDLPYGKYTVHQVEGMEGQAFVPDFTVFIREEEKTYSYILNNLTQSSYIRIEKHDVETGNIIPAANIGFQVRDMATGELVKQTVYYPTPVEITTYYTNDEGWLMLPCELPYGDYELIEVETCYGYVLDSTPVPFTVDGTQDVVVVEKHNIAQKGTITVEKTGEVFQSISVSDKDGESPIYTPVYEVKGLEGATYEIKAAEDIYTLDGTKRATKGETVDTITTKEDGTATSKALYLGKYEVIETKAPDRMVLNPTPDQVELTYAGQEIELTKVSTGFYNERQKVAISLEKLMEQNANFGIGMNGEVKNVAFGLYAAKEVVAADGSLIPVDGLIEIIAVSEDGTGIVQTDLPFGSYYLQERATDGHYILSTEKYPIEFAYVGQETEVVDIKVNDGEAIVNELILGSIAGKKVDEEGKALSGATIGLFTPATEEFTKDTAILVSISDEHGAFRFENVPYGTWIVREIEQPEGFILNNELHEVEIQTDEQVIELEIVNEFIRGNLHLTKYDKDYPENKLSGAVFEVYRDVNKNKEFDKEDTLLGTLDEEESGEYVMKDLLYGGVFVKETKAPDGFYLDKGVYYVSIETDGMTYEVENEAGKGFYNNVHRGNIKIVKTSSDGKLEGFTFRITGDNYDQTFTTDEKGEINIEGLRVGTYMVAEVENDASVGYKLPEPVIVELVVDETLVVNVHNEKVHVETPKTGDENNIMIWIGLLGISMAGLGTIFAVSKKDMISGVFKKFTKKKK